MTRGYISLLERGLRTPSEAVAGRIFRAIISSRLPANSVQSTFWEIDEEGYVVFGMRLRGKEHSVAWRGWKLEPDQPGVWGPSQLESYLNLYSVLISAFLEHLEVYPAERLEPLATPRPLGGGPLALELDHDLVEWVGRYAAEKGMTIPAAMAAILEWSIKFRSASLKERLEMMFGEERDIGGITPE